MASMSYQADFIAIACRDPKGAALFYDHIIPTTISEEFGPELVKQLLPEQGLRPEFNRDPYIQWIGYLGASIPPTLPTADQWRGTADGIYDVEKLSRFAAEAGIADCALYGTLPSRSAQPRRLDPCLVLSELRLVDASRISWDHVLEIRKDRSSIERLRNLRRFIFRDYTGRPESYIRDDIESRILQYEAAAKFWNLPVGKGVLEIAMTGDALAAVGSAIALALFGAPVAAAAAAGGAIAVGKAALAIAQRKREIELERRQNPISYLVDVRRASDNSI